MISASPVAAIPCFLNSAEAASTILLRVFAVSSLDILITQLFQNTRCDFEPTVRSLVATTQGYCTSISCPVAAKEGSPQLEDALPNQRRKFLVFHLTIKILHAIT